MAKSPISKPDARAWLVGLSRRGWAWEFLRRSPEYRRAFEQRDSNDCSPVKWGLLKYEDPALDALHADVFWRTEDCLEVLPMALNRDLNLSTGVTLNLEGLSCRVSVRKDETTPRTDILFSECGRFLQIAIFGNSNLRDADLVVPALDDPNAVMARTASLRRLNDLLFNKHMRQVLYPPESRAPRLVKVLSALDGWLAHMPQREIAAVMFSKTRIEREWNDPRENLRDQVRRAIGYGQALMNGGYRQFLRLTFARRIAARLGAPRA